jgi:hypothetical protein
MDWGAFAGGVAQTAVPTYLKLSEEKRVREDREKKKQEEEALKAAYGEAAANMGDIRGRHPLALPSQSSGIVATPAQVGPPPGAGPGIVPSAPTQGAIPPPPPYDPNAPMEEVVVSAKRGRRAPPGGAIPMFDDVGVTAQRMPDPSAPPPAEMPAMEAQAGAFANAEARPARLSTGEQSDYYYNMAETFMRHGQKNPRLFEQAMLYKERADQIRTGEISQTLYRRAATEGMDGIADYFESINDGNKFEYEEITEGKNAGKVSVTYGGNTTMVGSAEELAAKLSASMVSDPKFIAEQYDRAATRRTQEAQQEMMGKYYEVLGNNAAEALKLDQQRMKIYQSDDKRTQQEFDFKFGARQNLLQVGKLDPLLNAEQALAAADQVAAAFPEQYMQTLTFTDAEGNRQQQTVNTARAAFEQKIAEQQAKLDKYKVRIPGGAYRDENGVVQDAYEHRIKVAKAYDEATGQYVPAYQLQNDDNVYTSFAKAERALRAQDSAAKRSALPDKPQLKMAPKPDPNLSQYIREVNGKYEIDDGAFKNRNRSAVTLAQKYKFATADEANRALLHVLQQSGG